MPTLMRDGDTSPRITRYVVIGVVALVVLMIFFGAFGTVGAQQRGIKLRLGAVVGALEPGLYFKTPFVEDVVKMDVRIQKTEVDASAASKDLQNVSARIAVSYQLDPRQVVSVYQTLGKEFAPRIIDPAIQEAIKAATAKYSAEELVTKRSEVRDAAKENLKAKIAPHGIALVDFNIVNFDFSPAFNAAIESKVTQEQTALAEQNKTKTIKFLAEQKVAAAEGEKSAAIAKAQGEAESIRIRSEALKSNPAFLELERIAVEKEWASHWTGNVPQTVMGNTPLVPFMNFTPAK